MLDKYKETYDEIEVPKDLITKTSLLMKEEQEKQMEKKKGFFSFPMILGFSSVAVAIVVGVIYFNQPSNEVINTALVDGDTVNDVELSDGHMTFGRVNKPKEPGLILAEDDLYDVEEGTLKDAEDFFGEKIINHKIEGDYEKSEQKVERLFQNERLKNVRVLTTYVNNKQSVEISYEKDIDIIIHDNSDIKGVKCEVWYDEESEEYGVKFKQGDYVYKIVTDNFTQEEFIKFVNNFI